MPLAFLQRAVRLVRAQWEQIDRDAAAERAAAGVTAGAFSPRAFAVLVLSAVVMVLQGRDGRSAALRALLHPIFESRFGGLFEMTWWFGNKVAAYMVLPAICARLAGFKLRDCGLSTAGLRGHFWIYGVLYLALVPVIVAVSFTGPFQAMYPMYHTAGRSWADLAAWEVVYGVQFLGIEFFYRGFMVFLLRRDFGANAIFVMAIPYCMLHFGKPIAEVYAAIGAAIILGTLSLRTRSIWGGVALHLAVAGTMDALALAHTTGLPHRLWPPG